MKDAYRYTMPVLDDVANERAAQLMQWGDQIAFSQETMLAVLVEEVGEVACSILRKPRGGDLRTELIHVAAVAVQMVEYLDRRAGEGSG